RLTHDQSPFRAGSFESLTPRRYALSSHVATLYICRRLSIAHRREATYDVERTKSAALVRTGNTRGHSSRTCRRDRCRTGGGADRVARKTDSGGRRLQERPSAQRDFGRRLPGDDGDHDGGPSVRLLGLSCGGRDGQGGLGGRYAEKADGTQDGG